MKYSKLGKTGLVVSKVSLGMMSFGSPGWQPWVLPKAEAKHFVCKALDVGVNMFDTADFYSHGQSEEALGDAIAEVKNRHQLVIATKAGLPMSSMPNHGGLSKKHILASIESSLRRLRTDYIDLYQLHRCDTSTPIEETLDALDIAVRSGKVLHVGASNFSTSAIAPAVFAHRWRSAPRLSSMQLQYNLTYREDERDMIPLCVDNGAGVIVYSPLARGLLACKSTESSGLTERESVRVQSDLKAKQLYGSKSDLAIIAVVQEMAAERGVSPALIALAWLHAQPHVNSVLCGALELQHIDEAVAALDLCLSDDELERLGRLYEPRPVKDDAFSAVKAAANVKA